MNTISKHMKHLYSILIALLITIGAQAQNCYWTSSTAPGNVVVFTPTSTFPGPQYYAEWDLGNGALIQAPIGPFTYVFPAPGAYSICLSIMDSLLGTSVCTYCDSIFVGGCSFTNTQSPSNTAIFSFSANLSSSGTSAIWSFGDGTSGSGVFTTHTYSSPGTFIVTMNEVDSMGNIICSSTQSVTYANAQTCGFSFTQPSPGAPYIFNFTGSASSPSAVMTWDFGDGTAQLIGPSVAHTYAAPGVYTVCMTAMSFIDSCTYCAQITVTGGSTANCSYISIQDSINANLYYFFGTPSQLITGLIWDFGDGTTGVGATPTHQFTSPGSYLVCMNEIELATGNIVCSSCQTIVIGGSSGCTFTVTSSPSNPNSLTFFIASAPNTSYFWDFGDGTTFSGNNATHTYATPGVYTVCLTAGSGGAITCTSCQNVVIPSNPSCQANFASVSVGLMAYFVDQSVAVPLNVPPLPSPVYYTWSFGDGTSSTLQFPQHQYSVPGTYLVCLNVNTVGCNSTYCDSIVIDTVINNPVGCNAFFLFTQLNPYQLIGVNLSSGFNLTFNWDFGDGSTSNLAYPSHQYASTGSYLVCLTVADPSGCSSTYCDSLTVDSLGNIVYRGATSGFLLNIMSPAQLTSGISDTDAPSIGNIYPVPASEMINVTVSQNTGKNANYQVYSVDGKAVMNGNISGQDNSINIRNLEPGIYLLEVITSDGRRDSKPFVKQ